MKKVMKTTNIALETKIMIGAALICLIFSLFGFFLKDTIGFILGVLLGGVYSIINFKIIQFTLEKAMKMPPSKSQKYVQTRYFLRYLFTGVVIYLAIIIPIFNIIGVILGLVAIKFSVLLLKAFKKVSVKK